MPAMSGRAVEPVEIPPACPFVAFEDDRERRSTAPDHRHRCYAEPRPAPRALAHQERYCLTRDFPSCPTFQAWARREAARESAPGAAREVPAGRPPVDPGAWVAPAAAAAATSRYAPPPPPAGGISQLAAFDDPEPAPAEDAGAADSDDEGAGHAELAALVGGAAAGAAATDPAPAQAAADAPPFLAGRASGTSKGPAAGRTARTAAPRPPIATGDGGNPPWERPHRNELYPSLRTRSGLPSIPPVALALTALVVAAVLLFLLPSLLPGNGAPGSSNSVAPSDTAAATSVAPTIAAGPTPVIYVVRSGDLLSTIAARFHVTLAQLEAANPQITDPNKIKPGDKITIPTPGASPTASQGP
jgi:nucleoid-associated protein YgaU